jgi:hypothetical protein
MKIQVPFLGMKRERCTPINDTFLPTKASFSEECMFVVYDSRLHIESKELEILKGKKSGPWIRFSPLEILDYMNCDPRNFQSVPKVIWKREGLSL